MCEAWAFAIGLEQDGELIAGVIYDQFNGRSIVMQIAAEGTNWMTREYLRTCFDYPFNHAKVNKIIVTVDSTNTRAMRLDEHLGFQLEATIKDAGHTGDLIVYSMSKDQCRALTIVGNQNGKTVSSSTT